MKTNVALLILTLSGVSGCERTGEPPCAEESASCAMLACCAELACSPVETCEPPSTNADAGAPRDDSGAVRDGTTCSAEGEACRNGADCCGDLFCGLMGDVGECFVAPEF